MDNNFIQKILKLFKKITRDQLELDLEILNNFDINKNSDLEKECIFFIRFLLNYEETKKIKEIYSYMLTKSLKTSKIIKTKNFLNNDEEYLILSMFIFKALETKTIKNTSSIDYVNSDIAINNAYDFIKKFIIFFNFNLLREDLLKKEIFKIFNILIKVEILLEKKVRNNNKTVLEWSLGLSLNLDTSLNFFNIFKEKLSVVEWNNKKYLKGVFFTNIYDVFTENIKSNQRFKLKDEEYLNSLTNLHFYLSNEDLLRIIKIIELKEKINLDECEDNIIRLNNLIIENFKKISEIVQIEKENFINLIVFKNINEISLMKIEKGRNDMEFFFEEKVIKFTYDFICKKKEEDGNYVYLNTDNKKKIKDELMKIFKDFFEEYDKKNEVKLKFEEKITKSDKNDDDFDYWEFEDGNQKNVVIEKKVDWNEFSFFNFLTIIKRKELKILLKKNWKKILKKLNLNEVETTKNDNESFIKKNIDEKTFKFLSIKLISDSEYKLDYFLKKKIKTSFIEEKNKEIQKEISKLLIYNNLTILKNLKINDNVKIFIPFFFDFRGRFYFTSFVGPTNLKFSRYFYNYGVYTPEELKNYERSSLYEIISKYSSYTEKIKEKFKIKRGDGFVEDAVFWTCISIGKIGIDKSKIEISIEDLLNESINLINNSEKLTDLMDLIEFSHYENILISLKDKNFKKRFLLKDATASFIQNLIRLLGYKNENSLKHANLHSKDKWYDTYSFILKMWKESDYAKNLPKKVLDVYVRKTVKKSIMTNPYSARYITAFEYFKEGVFEKFTIKIEYGDEYEISFKDFYNFIEENVEDQYFLENNSKNIIKYIDDFWEKKEIIIESDDGVSNLVYFKINSYAWDVIINIPEKNIKIRKTKNRERIDINNMDIEKIKMSIRANWIHYIDALFVRDINRSMSQILGTIHDCFLVDILRTNEFILVANVCVNKRIFKEMNWNNKKDVEFFSIFIFI